MLRYCINARKKEFLDRYYSYETINKSHFHTNNFQIQSRSFQHLIQHSNIRVLQTHVMRIFTPHPLQHVYT